MVIAFTLVLFALQLADSYSTRMILSKGGVERNKIAKTLMGMFGVTGFLTIKTFGVSAAGYWIGTQNIYLLATVICWYFIVVRYNWRSM
jgi:hypothetical protein